MSEFAPCIGCPNKANCAGRFESAAQRIISILEISDENSEITESYVLGQIDHAQASLHSLQADNDCGYKRNGINAKLALIVSESVN